MNAEPVCADRSAVRQSGWPMSNSTANLRVAASPPRQPANSLPRQDQTASGSSAVPNASHSARRWPGQSNPTVGVPDHVGGTGWPRSPDTSPRCQFANDAREDYRTNCDPRAGGRASRTTPPLRRARCTAPWPVHQFRVSPRYARGPRRGDPESMRPPTPAAIRETNFRRRVRTVHPCLRAGPAIPRWR